MVKDYYFEICRNKHSSIDFLSSINSNVFVLIYVNTPMKCIHGKMTKSLKIRFLNKSKTG